MQYTILIISVGIFSVSSAFAAKPLPPTYKVFDASHRKAVGTTVDGINVTAKFKGHDVIFVIRAGGSDNPNYANALGIVYELPDCQGIPYIASYSDQGMDPDYPIMEGVLPIVSDIGRLPGAPAGEYVYGDPYSEAKTFKGSYSFFPTQFADDNPQCINFAPFTIYGLPVIEFTIDWTPPLSTKRP